MLRSFSMYILLLAMAGVLMGCSDDPAAPKADSGTLINGVVESDAAGFTYLIDRASHPQGDVDGPFVLVGRNLHYDDAFGALVVDLLITNAGRLAHPEPVTITFLRLLPDGVTIIDPPNGKPTFTFEFANDDGMWAPGETSFPLTVSFVIEPGVSVAFAAEIGLGFGSASGVISGHVWSDVDRDGHWGDDEVGLGGVPISIFDGNPDPDPRKLSLVVTTDDDGGYTFTGLAAGTYAVRVRSRPDIVPTTPEVLHVLLTTNGDGVGSFAGADFGVALTHVDRLALPSTADVMIRSDLAARLNDNHGADPFLGVGTSRSPDGAPDAIRSLVRFDLRVIQRPIITAHLEMTVAAFRDGYDQTYALGIYPVLASGDRTPWIEGNGSEVRPLPAGVEWVDPADGVAWIGAEDGGDANNQSQPDFSSEAAAMAVVAQADHHAGDVIRWDVTRLVHAWQSGDVANLGVVVRDVETAGTFRQIWLGARDGLLRDYTDVRVQEGPRLVLSFE